MKIYQRNSVASVLYQMELIGQVEKRLVMTPRRPGQVIDGANRIAAPIAFTSLNGLIWSIGRAAEPPSWQTNSYDRVRPSLDGGAPVV